MATFDRTVVINGTTGPKVKVVSGRALRSDAPQPFQYQGSKRIFAREIIQYLPRSRGHLVEPFAGSAAVSLAAVYYGRAESFHINDINEPLMELLDRIISNPVQLVEEYAVMWHEQQSDPKSYYFRVRDRFNAAPNAGELLYLLSRAVKGAVRYNRLGEFNQSPDNRRLGTRPETLLSRFQAISHLLRGRTVITSRPYEEVLESAGPDSVLYMDPPYEGVSGVRDSRYADGIPRGEFVAELCRLVRRGHPFVLSYDGRTGDKRYGEPLPDHLRLTRLEIDVGPSTSATLNGRRAHTVEALYLSPALVDELGGLEEVWDQATLFSA